MTRHSLAIPVAVFAVALAALPLSCAEFLDNPRTKYGSSSVAPAHAAQTTLSDEDMARLLLVRRDYREAQGDVLQADHSGTPKTPPIGMNWAFRCTVNRSWLRP